MKEFELSIGQVLPEDRRPSRKTKVTVIDETLGVSLKLDGYGTNDMETGGGPVVLVEVRDGVAHVVIWADIKTEEPTHVISLEGAKEEHRRPE
jgi:hypothetical protein